MSGAEEGGLPTDPPVTPQDESCAVFVRNALFPLRRDYATSNNKHQHHHIHPALDALDRLRKELVEKRETPFSSLFPRGVMLVPTASGEMLWNGQPNIDDGAAATVQVVPDVLSVKCMECSSLGSSIQKGVRSFLRSKKRYDGSEESELVVCSDRVLQADYRKKVAAGKDAQTLLNERKDLPAYSMKIVEESLAHEMSKLVVLETPPEGNYTAQSPTRTASAKTMSCEEFAGVELFAAKVAECMFEQKEAEIRRGSRLGPTGFSWLPRSLQTNFQNRCSLEVAKEFTAREFGGKEAKSCVNKAWKKASSSSQ
mmetsp:Transcript_8681/g.13833  ORF Transcript_8681/g.13833 Transcript_8681/m.13833 type:complete len:312 (+) Transcript_8681:91-1026(+)